MSLATRRPESTTPPGISPGAGRPLFVPAGIPVVRTGPTTRAELERLLSDPQCDFEHSGVRLIATASASPGGLLRALVLALGFSTPRSR